MAASLASLPVDPRFEVVDSGAAAERLRIENRFYSTSMFRKCHLELAVGGAGLNVLHCVMYPWAAHDLPLFSVDMVGFGVRVAARHRRSRCLAGFGMLTPSCTLVTLRAAARDARDCGPVPLAPRPFAAAGV